MSARTTLLEDAWPVALLVLPASIGPDDVREMIELVERLYAKKERYALITDTRPVTAIPGARERRMLGEWLSQPDQIENQRLWNVGSSTIMSNTLIRGGLQALYWLWTPPNPQHAARDLPEAFAFCVSKLTDARVRLPVSAAELEARAARALTARGR